MAQPRERTDHSAADSRLHYKLARIILTLFLRDRASRRLATVLEMAEACLLSTGLDGRSRCANDKAFIP